MSCTLFLDKIENANKWNFGYPMRDYLRNEFGENAVLDYNALGFLRGLSIFINSDRDKKILTEVMEYIAAGGQIKFRLEC